MKFYIQAHITKYNKNSGGKIIAKSREEERGAIGLEAIKTRESIVEFTN